MCRQIDLRLRHVGPRCGPTARPTRVSRAARQHDFDARAEHAPDSAGGQNHAGPAKLSRATVGSPSRSLGSARSNPVPRFAAVTLRAKARQSLAARGVKKNTLAAGEAASRVRRPAEARSRPTVRRLGCGTPARRGGGASPTTYRGMCRARGAGRRAKTRGCGTTRPKKGEGRAAELDQGGHARLVSPPKRSGAIQAEAGCAGLAPEANLKVAEWGEGRGNRPD